LVETNVTKDVVRKTPTRTYCLLAVMTVGTMGFSNASLGYLNYPTQVIFKCCKLIPVLVGSILIQGKKYGVLDFIAASFMCIGLILFTLTDSKVQPNFDTFGIAMISVALLFDAVIGNVQEVAMKKYKSTNTEMVLYSYSIGSVYIFFIVLLSGQFGSAVTFCSENIVKTYGYALMFSLTGYLGIQAVLLLVKLSGAFVAVTVTTMRKALTITLSFIFFSKPFAFQYLWAGLLVLIGIYLNFFSKRITNAKLMDILKTSNVLNRLKWSKSTKVKLVAEV